MFEFTNGLYLLLSMEELTTHLFWQIIENTASAIWSITLKNSFVENNDIVEHTTSYRKTFYNFKTFYQVKLINDREDHNIVNNSLKLCIFVIQIILNFYKLLPSISFWKQCDKSVYDFLISMLNVGKEIANCEILRPNDSHDQKVCENY